MAEAEVGAAPPILAADPAGGEQHDGAAAAEESLKLERMAAKLTIAPATADHVAESVKPPAPDGGGGGGDGERVSGTKTGDGDAKPEGKKSGKRGRGKKPEAAAAADDGDADAVFSTQNLYVQGLSSEFTDEALYELCIQYGEIISTKAITRNTQTGATTCKGYGFVCFVRPEDAARALEGLVASNMDASYARVPSKTRAAARQESLATRHQQRQSFQSKKSNQFRQDHQRPPQPDPTNLYFSNLPLKMMESHLEEVLTPYGQPLSTRILMLTSGVSRGIGFARMQSQEVCNKVIKAFDGFVFEGTAKPVVCKFADNPRRANGRFGHGSPRGGPSGGASARKGQGNWGPPSPMAQAGAYSPAYQMPSGGPVVYQQPFMAPPYMMQYPYGNVQPNPVVMQPYPVDPTQQFYKVPAGYQVMTVPGQSAMYQQQQPTTAAGMLPQQQVVMVGSSRSSPQLSSQGGALVQQQPLLGATAAAPPTATPQAIWATVPGQPSVSEAIVGEQWNTGLLAMGGTAAQWAPQPNAPAGSNGQPDGAAGGTAEEPASKAGAAQAEGSV